MFSINRKRESTIMKLGISPINWSNDDTTEMGGSITFEEIIQQMSQLQFKGCEVGNKFPRDCHLLKKYLRPLNLKVTGMWFDSYLSQIPITYQELHHETTIQRFHKCVKFLKCLGAKVVIVNEDTNSIFRTSLPIFDEKKPIFDEKTFEVVIEGLNKLSNIANDAGLKLAYHPHLGTGIQNFHEITYLMDNTDSSKISLLLDTGHLYLAGINPLMVIKKYGKRIAHVHLKDVRKEVFLQAKKNHLSFLESVRLGLFNVPNTDNVIDFPVILRELKKIGYDDWYIVEAEQDPDKYSPIVYGQIAKQYLEKLIAR
jgi:inosose dehydratase